LFSLYTKIGQKISIVTVKYFLNLKNKIKLCTNFLFFFETKNFFAGGRQAEVPSQVQASEKSGGNGGCCDQFTSQTVEIPNARTNQWPTLTEGRICNRWFSNFPKNY
jgi:hypothetical protein